MPYGRLKLLKEIAGGAGDVDTARDTALAIFNAFHNPCRLGALRAVRTLIRVHDLLAVTGFGNLCHGLTLLEWLCRAPR